MCEQMLFRCILTNAIVNQNLLSKDITWEDNWRNIKQTENNALWERAHFSVRKYEISKWFTSKEVVIISIILSFF